MDVGQAAAVAVASLPFYGPYLIKMGEGAASELGKLTAQGIVKKAQDLYQVISDKFHKTTDSRAELALKQAVQNPQAGAQLEPLIRQQAQIDPEFSAAIIALATDIRNILLDCLKDRMTMPELREVYTRLHIGFDDLIGQPATRSEKAQALIEKMEMEKRIPELIAAMWRVNPRLEC